MAIGKKFRGVGERRPIIPYVCPDGRIVDKQWAVAVNDRVLKADDEGDRTGASVHVHPRLQREGYVLLRDLYEAEGFTEGFREYQSWAQRVYFGSHRGKFPDKLLPQEVLRRRKEAAEGRVETWRPSIAARPSSAEAE